MASVFWDANGNLFIDYLEKDKTINSDYYMTLLDRLSAEINQDTPTSLPRQCTVPQVHENDGQSHGNNSEARKLGSVTG